MANIRVDLGYTIKDGTEVTFRSPVDCSAITGLIVYYLGEDGNTTSKVFALADAHGNNVGDIDHLFAEDVVVKVILDVTKGMAFVQNADTNKYIEDTFLKKSGGTVTGMVQLKPTNGTSVIATETYRNTSANSSKTRNVILSSGDAAMQLYKNALGTEPSTEVNRLTLTDTDTQLMKPLTVASGGTGAITAAGAITNLGIKDYVVAQGESNNWHYRKWKSGRAECWYCEWFVPTASGLNPATLTHSYMQSFTLPFKFTDTMYSVNATVQHGSGYGIITRTLVNSTTAFNVYWDGNSAITDASARISVCVNGYYPL